MPHAAHNPPSPPHPLSLSLFLSLSLSLSLSLQLSKGKIFYVGCGLPARGPHKKIGIFFCDFGTTFLVLERERSGTRNPDHAPSESRSAATQTITQKCKNRTILLIIF
ncbi:hypothetical protein O6H91_07G115600 [Diphasiastrum complanatum]|uniref:Uncharacterized protein n=1 Tax=Diphasiastrum complanatum TaxID=34168 RepID=A0ACC2D9Y3_DIPCM|nr:hypothetical protein O6H91_07G115600 [Diphasiastrum complanatum]